jgi:hypothetical protein
MLAIRVLSEEISHILWRLRRKPTVTILNVKWAL